MDQIFPLMMTPFEYYMWVDHHPEYPMEVETTLRFTGEIDRTRFEEAVHETMRRHPLFSCTVDPSTRPLPSWIYHENYVHPVQWEDASAPTCRETLPLRGIDLTQTPGVRIRVHVADGYSRLHLLVHHCVSDGLGIFRMLGDLLAFYARSMGETIAIPELDPATLSERKNFPKVFSGHFRSLRSSYKRIKSFLRWVIIPPAQLMSPSAKRLKSEHPHLQDESLAQTQSLPEDQQPCRQTLELDFDTKTVSKLRECAKSVDATLNVLLMRDLYVCIAKWHEKYGPRKTKSYWFRVGVPVSMRGENHEKLPAANVVSYVFPVRRLCASSIQPQQLLSDLNQEILETHTENKALYFARLLNRTQNHPWIVRYFVGSTTCFATAIHSYLGDIPRRFEREFPTNDNGSIRVGNLQFDGMISAPPVRPRTGLAIAYHLYHGQMAIGFHFDPHRFTMAEAKEFTELFRQQILKNLEPSGMDTK
ncbi:MAG: hypothetical protein PHE53_02510 [Thermoguttaceae bacterium]|nr:hypothetical protein [Thermoguttaceae bacterium]